MKCVQRLIMKNLLYLNFNINLTRYDKKKNIQEFENKIKEREFQWKFGGLI